MSKGRAGSTSSSAAVLLYPLNIPGRSHLLGASEKRVEALTAMALSLETDSPSPTPAYPNCECATLVSDNIDSVRIASSGLLAISGLPPATN
jgi:hypothetical protein